MNDKKILTNKNILFLSPAFFSYEKKVKEAMESAGANVFMYDERSVTSALARAILKVVPGIFNRRSLKYYSNIIKVNHGVKFDYILIIKCDMISSKILKMFRDSFPNAKLCLHLWDSKKNIKGIEKKIKFFDYASSFDLCDCDEDSKLNFRPLFYTNDFENHDGADIKYDLCFCGTIHSDRYYVIKKIFDEAKNKGLRTFCFPFLQSNFIYYFYKITAKGFSKAKKSDFSFAKKTIEEISEIENSSNVILDIQHPKQTGLTIRTIEMIGSRKKIITTNENIVKYDFYNKNNIAVIDRNNPHLNFEFFESKYEKIPEDIYKKYSLNQWIYGVLGE